MGLRAAGIIALVGACMWGWGGGGGPCTCKGVCVGVGEHV